MEREGGLQGSHGERRAGENREKDIDIEGEKGKRGRECVCMFVG